jgi:protein phosphatase PTC2/3
LIEGIWDCLSSQDVVNFVRYQVSQGKELTEIGELICEYCLAPDTSSGAGIGCDNMTVLTVALTHGRSKEEWYAWVAERVKNNYGYNTPSTLPQLYAQSRLMAFRANREINDKHQRHFEEKYGAKRNPAFTESSTPSTESSTSSIESSTSSIESSTSSMQAPSNSDASLSGSESDDELPEKMKATKWGANGPISYQPGGDIINHSGQLMFVNDDDVDDVEEGNAGQSFFSETLGLGRAEPPGSASNLKAQLTEYEKEIQEEHSSSLEHPGDAETDGTKEGENYSPFLVNIQYLFTSFFIFGRHPFPFLLSHFSEHEPSSKLPNGDAKGSSEPETPPVSPDGHVAGPVAA